MITSHSYTNEVQFFEVFLGESRIWLLDITLAVRAVDEHSNLLKFFYTSLQYLGYKNIICSIKVVYCKVIKTYNNGSQKIIKKRDH